MPSGSSVAAFGSWVVSSPRTAPSSSLAVVFLAAVFLAVAFFAVAFLAVVFFTAAFLTGVSSSSAAGSVAGAAGAAGAVAFLLVTVLATYRLRGGALGGTLRCDALAGALGLCGTDHQRHTLFLEDLVEAAQYVLPLSGRNLVSFEGPTHVIASDLPSAFPAQ
ncbi:hypothetical protein STENM327S_01742 [Streptomyces tendae]